MSRHPIPDPPVPVDDVDDDFDAWSLADLEGLADGHSLRAPDTHDSDD